MPERTPSLQRHLGLRRNGPGLTDDITWMANVSGNADGACMLGASCGTGAVGPRLSSAFKFDALDQSNLVWRASRVYFCGVGTKSKSGYALDKASVA